MSSLFDNLSDELFQVLKGSGRILTLYGKDGNRTYEPKNARRVFAEPDKMMISVNEQGSDSEVKVYLSSSTDIREISKLINTLRSITARYNVLLNVRKFGRELRPKDFAYQASAVTEASMWGSARSSYQSFGQTKLIIRHCQPISEDIVGSRGRNILSMFVETKDGERFRFTENHLSAGRAFAQHINQGGKPYDQIGIDLTILALESLQLTRLSRYIYHSRNLLGEEAISLRPLIKTRITELRKNFLTMSRPRGYKKIQEAGLPVFRQTLNESATHKMNELADLLQINSNHALAETLLPVALLLGENMNKTMNEMFNGVINLGASELDALVEALSSEYGYDSDSWTHMGESIGFTDAVIFEDAKDFLEMMEASYQINEEDAIANYATQWSLARYRMSGEQGEMDKDQKNGISELTDGLRQILSGHIDMPEYPWGEEPSFRDENARIRFFLDLFVSQHKLANTATLNYVSTIIDKMAEGKKLDGAEQTIASKLYTALEADIDLGEGIVDESSYDFPYDDRDDAKVEKILEYFEQTFDGEDFLKTQGYADFIDPTMSDDDKTEPTKSEYFIKGIAHCIIQSLEDEGVVNNYQGTESFIQNMATELFKKKVLPILKQNGWNITETIGEFADAVEEPEYHGFSAGDHVGTDFGPGQIDSVEGDIAVVHFLNGGSKKLHVDDLDKVPGLGESNEEGDLSRWFKSFTPESVLGLGSLNEFSTDPHTEGKMARQAGHSIHDNPYNPDSQEGFAWARGHVGMSNPDDIDVDEDLEPSLDPDINSDDDPTYFYGSLRGNKEDFINAVAAKHGWSVEEQAESILDGGAFEEQNSNALRYIMEIAEKRGEEELATEIRDYLGICESQANELSQDKIGNYFNRAFTDRSRAERSGDSELDEISRSKAISYFDRAAGDRARAERGSDAGDPKAANRLRRRDSGLAMAFDRIHEEMVNEGYPIHPRDLSEIFNTLHKKAREMFADPESYGMDKPGQDDADETEMENINKISNTLSGLLKDLIMDAYYAHDPDDGQGRDHNPPMESLEEAPSGFYHSVFVKNTDGSFAHHFDADNAADAKEERDYLKRQGDKPLVIKVPKDQANWGQGEGKTDPDAFVKAHLASKAEAPKMGGDQGQNLIDQTKVVHNEMDEAANDFSDYSDEDLEKAIHSSSVSSSRSANNWLKKAQAEMSKRHGSKSDESIDENSELAALLKNARFRMR